MWLSDIAVKRPVFATVMSAILIVFGVLSFFQLPLRELPDVERPVVTVNTTYPGASAEIVESRITQLIEEQISGVEGIESITSASRDGLSWVSIEFNIGRDLESAANDVRERVSRILRSLPEDVDPPEVTKATGHADVVLWFNLASSTMSMMELTDYAERYIADRLSIIDGVSRVQIGGQKRYSMRIWLDRKAMAARGLTVPDIESALTRENAELPAGEIESPDREIRLRLKRQYQTPNDFAQIVVGAGRDGQLVRMGEIAKIELGPATFDEDFRGNGVEQIGIGIERRSSANTLEIARAAYAEVEKIRQTLPEGIQLYDSFDTTIFIDRAIKNVYRTLIETVVLVVAVMFLFLGSWRATFIPATTLPVCLAATFGVLAIFGYSINLLTLLGLVLAIGLVVDDAIVVLENIYRRIERGEPPLIASYRGSRQVGFAVIVTTLVVVAVFVPIFFLEGTIGRLFAELAVAVSAAVIFSAFVALTLTPMLCSKVLTQADHDGGYAKWIDGVFKRMGGAYRNALDSVLDKPMRVSAFVLMLVVVAIGISRFTPQQFAPEEDQGTFFVNIFGPEGSSMDYMRAQMTELEKRTAHLYADGGPVMRFITNVPNFGLPASARLVVILKPWEERERSTQDVMNEVRKVVDSMPGIRGFAMMRPALGMAGGARGGRPVEFVIQGTDWQELARWRDLVMDRASQNPGLRALDADYDETTPQVNIAVNQERAADLGVSVTTIGRTLQVMNNGRNITTFMRDGKEYDVIVEGLRSDRTQASDLNNIFVRSERTGQLVPLSNLVTFQETSDASILNRYDRLRAITITASLAPGYSLGEALSFLENVVKTELPPTAQIDYKGESREFKQAGSAIYFTFGLALLIVFLVMAAQFESFIHPLIIMATVPIAIFGGLFGLFITGSSFNIYSQVGLIILIGLAAKNGILLVEFTNQLRQAGVDFREAILRGAQFRLRPILMTSVATAAGAVPLVIASGAGANARFSIGVVIFAGVLFATAITLFVIPVYYHLLAKSTRHAGVIEDEIAAFERDNPIPRATGPQPQQGD
jgi:multidrug efflux pump